MIPITKQEAEMITAAGRGKDIFISSRTHNGKKQRWATLSEKTTELLEKSRKASVTYTYTGKK